MTEKKGTKRVLLFSCLTMLMCICLLIGTTFSLFTDSVTSEGNKIQSGALKLDLELYDKETQQWNSIKESKQAIFDYDNWNASFFF